MNISGRHRIVIVLSVCWVLANYFLIKPYRYTGDWNSFMLVGFGPVGASWAWQWVRTGFAADRQKGPNMDDSIRTAIDERLEMTHQVTITVYRYDSNKKLHIFGITRGKESGHLAFSSEFISDHTATGVIQRLASPEVKRQFDQFNDKRLLVTNTGVRVELGG